VAPGFGAFFARNGSLSSIPTAAAGGLGGILVGLLALGVDRERQGLKSPTQLIRDSGRTGMLAGLIITVPLALTEVIRLYPVSLWTRLASGLLNGVTSGLVFGLVFGLDAVMFHYAFRLRMRRRGGGPLRWVTFLDWTTDHLLLMSTGASYQWIHLELRDYLATSHNPEPIPPMATHPLSEEAFPHTPSGIASLDH
jgi:hypothetical protein